MTIRIGDNILASSTKGVLHTTGDEEATGIKTFKDNVFAPNVLDSNKVTNFISKIPNDIKLELGEGVLTLKSGSKVYVPSGSGVFDVVTTSSDITFTYSSSTSSANAFVFFNKSTNTLYIQSVGYVTSGTTAPSGSGTWYDITNNLVKRYTSGSLTSSDNSFPICLITYGTSYSGGHIGSIDQVFNGMGYIGSSFFVLPRVEGYAYNGYNDTGYNNDNWKVESVQVNTFTTETGRYYSTINYEGALTSATSFDIEKDKRKTLVATLDLSSGKIQTTSSMMKLGNSVNDENLVHKTTDETIAGTKTFTDEIIINGQENYVELANPSSKTPTLTAFVRKSTSANNTDNMVFGLLDSATSGKPYKSSVAVYYDVDTSKGYVTVPTPDAGDNTTKVATTNWCYDSAKSTNLVHRDSSETITGAKTFSSYVYCNADVRYRDTTKNADLASQSTTSELWVGPRFVDKNDLQGGLIQYKRNASGIAEMNLQARALSTNTFTTLSVCQKPDGTGYTSTPTPTEDTTTSVQIDTVGARNTKVNAKDALCVHLAGAETITGAKTFNQVVTVFGNIDQKNSDVSRGTAPSASTYKDIRFVDSSGKWLAGLENSVYTDKSSKISLIISDTVNDTTNSKASLRVCVNSSGVGYTEVTAPSATNSTSDIQIASTGWVNDPTKSTNVVHRTGVETITGAKTFDSASSAGTRYNLNIINSGFTKANALAQSTVLYPGSIQFGWSDKISGWFENYCKDSFTCSSMVASSDNSNYGALRIYAKGSSFWSEAPAPTDDNTTSVQIDTVGKRNYKLCRCNPTIRFTKYADIASGATSYTAPIDGFMRVKIGGTYSWYLYINGTIFQEQVRNDSDACVTTWVTIPVLKGDVLTHSGNTYAFYGGAMWYPY